MASDVYKNKYTFSLTRLKIEIRLCQVVVHNIVIQIAGYNT